MTAIQADHPASPLMEFILGILAPLLMAGSITDVNLAREAAAEAIAFHKAGNQSDLMIIGQIIAFAVTALDNLRLSMTSELSLAMKLKLRGSANTLSRSARSTGLRLQLPHHAPEPQAPEPQAPEPQAPEHQAPEPQAPDTEAVISEPAGTAGSHVIDPLPETPQPQTQQAKPVTPSQPMTAEHQNRLHWATAMMAEAAKLRTSPASATAEEQRVNQLWEKVLTNVASDLTKGNYPKAAPGMSKAELLRTTLMSGDASFPAHLIKRRK